MAGTLTLSIEIELGWGMHDMDKFSHLSENRSSETQTLRNLLNITESQDIPITFPVVGHLLHESCDGTHDGAYPEDWWDNDPGTNREFDPHFYAPDLVHKIEASPINHEISTHTYSHILADEATPDQLDLELKKVNQVHTDFKIPTPTSIVMPRHHEPDYTVLADRGIETIRRPIRDYKPSFNTAISKAWWLWNRSHPGSSIQMKDGILETTATPHPSLTAVTLPNGQASPHPIFSVIPKRLRRRRHRRYLKNAIDLAATDGSHVHLWTHLHNLSNEDQWLPVENALSYIAEQRDKGRISIRRMNELEKKHGM